LFTCSLVRALAELKVGRVAGGDRELAANLEESALVALRPLVCALFVARRPQWQEGISTSFAQFLTLFSPPRTRSPTLANTAPRQRHSPSALLAGRALTRAPRGQKILE